MHFALGSTQGRGLSRPIAAASLSLPRYSGGTVSFRFSLTKSISSVGFSRGDVDHASVCSFRDNWLWLLAPKNNLVRSDVAALPQAIDFESRPTRDHRSRNH